MIDVVMRDVARAVERYSLWTSTELGVTDFNPCVTSGEILLVMEASMYFAIYDTLGMIPMDHPAEIKELWVSQFDYLRTTTLQQLSNDSELFEQGLAELAEIVMLARLSA